MGQLGGRCLYLRDKESGIFSDPDELHVLDHKGEFFKVRGPLNVPRSPQGQPLLVQAGASEPGKELGTRVAETNDNKSRQSLLLELAARENLTIRQLYEWVAGARGHRVIHGTPESIADQLEEWFVNEAADGFNLLAPTYPAGLVDFAERVIPILQKRGLFRTEYEASSLRDNLGLPIPANRHASPACRRKST